MSTVHFCDECRWEKGWPVSITIAKDSTCEICFEKAYCYVLDDSILGRSNTTTNDGSLIACPDNCDLPCKDCHLFKETGLCDIHVMIDDKKYTIIMKNGGGLEVLRYGEKWRDCTGDGLIYSLAYEVNRLRNKLKDVEDIFKKEDE